MDPRQNKERKSVGTETSFSDDEEPPEKERRYSASPIYQCEPPEPPPSPPESSGSSMNQSEAGSPEQPQEEEQEQSDDQLERLPLREVPQVLQEGPLDKTVYGIAGIVIQAGYTGTLIQWPKDLCEAFVQLTREERLRAVNAAFASARVMFIRPQHLMEVELAVYRTMHCVNTIHIPEGNLLLESLGIRRCRPLCDNPEPANIAD